MQDSKYTFIDLFSGCGGLSLGFEMAGYKSLLAIDNWQDALDTYKHNTPEARTLCGDLSKINPEDIKREYNIDRVSVIIGGPPCQGFSIAGKRIIDDERNKLYKSFVGFVRCFMPDAFVMENVPNILSIGGGIVKESIIKDFSELGYNVNYKVLLASDYGVPQNRRRAVFVGLKNGEYTFPSPTIPNAVTTEEALSDLPDDSVMDGDAYPLSAQSDYQQFIRQGCTTLYNHQATIHTEQTTRIISMVPDGGNYKDLPKELQQTRKVHIAWTRLNSKKPSITIDTGHNHHFHYLYNRVPTARESARLQSFPDSFVFTHGKTSQLKQIGNAVPLRKVIDRLDIEEPKYYFSQKAVQGVKNAKNNMKRGLWQDLNAPCLTLTSHLAKVSMNSRDPILLVDADKELYRRFTPREAARIQSFPDTFKLHPSEAKSYKQIGNAIPPVMMWYIALNLIK